MVQWLSRIGRVRRCGPGVSVVLGYIAVACGSTESAPEPAGSAADSGARDAAADAAVSCSGPIDVELIVWDQSGAFVGQANVTLSSEAMDEVVGRSDAFGSVSLQVAEPGTYQVLAGKLVQLDPDGGCALDEFVAFQSMEIVCSNDPIEVRGEWACADPQEE
jgi:hypothetical protein